MLVALMLIGSLWATDCPHGSDRFNCVKFVKNYDGDTITVDVPGVHPFFGKNLHVRVRGVDTPEIKGKNTCEKEWGRAAKRLVEAELSHAKRIDLQIDNKDKLDKYGRLLANILYDDKKNIAEVLIRNKMAVPYFGGKKEVIDWCKMMNARKGIQ